MLLALDTSTDYASIALIREERLAAELIWDVGRRHSQELFDRLSWLLSRCGARPADLTSVAVARGPGSFNGLRVGVAMAKSLAFALGLALYTAGTLDVIAWGHASAGATGTLMSVMEAGRGELYVARYRASADEARAPGEQIAGGLWRISDPEVTRPEALVAAISGTALICGEWRPETRDALETALGADVRFAAGGAGRRASWLAALALARRAHGQADDPAGLEPLYLRRPAITASTKHVELDGGPSTLLHRQSGAAEKGDARALRR